MGQDLKMAETIKTENQVHQLTDWHLIRNNFESFFLNDRLTDSQAS